MDFTTVFQNGIDLEERMKDAEGMRDKSGMLLHI